MQHDPHGWRDYARRLIGTLHCKLLGKGASVRDFSDGPGIAFEVREDTEVGVHKVVSIADIADGLTFIK